ncbi:hypothetical protein [Streptomyces sp. NPDC002232]|uniref:effector-associated constant component EACC1 n=1 Tax=unclassified Streptomyces TaxID=2593676 RepID=UPI00367601C8
MVEIRVRFDGEAVDSESLEEWLRAEPLLQGRVRRPAVTPEPGKMGSPLGELVVGALISGTAGSVMTAVVDSIARWFRRPGRRNSSATSVTVVLDDRIVTLTVDDAGDVQRSLQPSDQSDDSAPTSTSDAAGA